MSVNARSTRELLARARLALALARAHLLTRKLAALDKRQAALTPERLDV
jgi:hypothetical protein